MAYRSSRRWLAPAALAAAGTALFVTVSSGGDADGAARPQGAPAAGESRPARASSYTVKPGDVLATIAETTGVPLTRIERLNPGVDATALHAGQQIKIAP